MSRVIKAPVKMIEAVAGLHFPPGADRRLGDLMDRNSNGALSAEERVELEELVELSETLSVVRADALYLLGRKLP